MAGVKYGSLVGTAPRFVAPASGSSLSLGWSNDRSALAHIPAPLQLPKIFFCKVLCFFFFPCSTEQKVEKGHFSSKCLCPSASGLCLTLSGHFHFSPSFFGFGHLHSWEFCIQCLRFYFSCLFAWVSFKINLEKPGNMGKRISGLG